jgi:hypothetical protein
VNAATAFSMAQGVEFARSKEKGHKFMMEEVLSKTIDSRTPLEEMEFCELSLLDEANNLGTRHRIRQAHGAWSEIDGQIMWDQEEVEYFWILAQAKERYEERRRALAERGFIHSDMDPML